MIRAMARGDVGATTALLREVGLGGAVANLGRYLTWQPACGWVADEDGQIAGSVTVLRWGDVGFVGCMAVSPSGQGRGLGRQLLEHAHAACRRAGVVSFLLEATPAGEPLYARLGYAVSGETVIATRVATGDAAPSGDVDRAAVLALDRVATGLDRGDMIGGLVDERGPGVVRPGGYGLVVGERLGPLIARDDDTGRALVAALVAPCTVVTAPAGHPPALRALEDHGFAVARTLRRMHLGAPPAAPPHHVWALASPGAG